jgi:hypothetical protein
MVDTDSHMDTERIYHDAVNDFWTCDDASTITARAVHCTHNIIRGCGRRERDTKNFIVEETRQD